MDGHDDNGKPGIHCGKNCYPRIKLFYLNHSCDEWIIGGTEQARELIAELQHLVDENPDVPDYKFRSNQ